VVSWDNILWLNRTVCSLNLRSRISELGEVTTTSAPRHHRWSV
jgi:hypothetical protein